MTGLDALAVLQNAQLAAPGDIGMEHLGHLEVIIHFFG